MVLFPMLDGFMLHACMLLLHVKLKISFCYVVNRESLQTGPAALNSFINQVQNGNTGMNVLKEQYAIFSLVVSRHLGGKVMSHVLCMLFLFPLLTGSFLRYLKIWSFTNKSFLSFSLKHILGQKYMKEGFAEERYLSIHSQTHLQQCLIHV